MAYFELAEDEIVLLSVEDAGHGVASSGGWGAASRIAREYGDLTLTNAQIVFTTETGLFKKQIEIKRYPLDEIKIYKNIAQVKPSKPSAGDRYYPVDIYFRDSCETFYLPPRSKKDVELLVESINEVLTGQRIGFRPEDIGSLGIGRKLKGAKVPEAIGGVIGAAKPITEGLADAVAPLVPVASTIASSRVGARTGKLSTLMGVVDAVSRGGLGDSPETPLKADARKEEPVEQDATIQEQISALKNLKELLDEGILTQEEFDNKKKQILGM